MDSISKISSQIAGAAVLYEACLGLEPSDEAREYIFLNRDAG
jgi:hypothetical protein